jgi:zinc transport system substrate-binding protein
MGRRTIAPIMALAIAMLCGPCFAAGGPVAGRAPDVVASIKPVQSLVAAVMKGVGRPALIVTGGQSEHTNRLKPSDAQTLSRADVIFWIGPDLETFLIAPLETLGSKARIVALDKAAGVRTLKARRGGLWESGDGEDHGGAHSGDHGHGGIDPHIWLDPANAMAMTRAIAATLARIDPAKAAIYRSNAARSVSALKILDRDLARRLAPVRTRPYIVFHDGYHYLERRYGLNAVGAVTVAPGRPIGPRRIEALRHAIAARGVVCVFREPQFTPRLVQTIVKGTDARVGVLDPLGAGFAPGPALYPALMHRLAASLDHCLSKKP